MPRFIQPTSACRGLRLVAIAAGSLACGGETQEATALRSALSDGTSSEAPYLVPLLPGVSFQALLTVGDSPAKDNYPMVGIPDGLGARKLDDGNLMLYMNHELNTSAGGVRAHGAKGAFVSTWKIQGETGLVKNGADLIQSVVTWNTASGSYNAPAKGISIGRLCSADLPARSAFVLEGDGDDFPTSPFFMSGEEVGFGRAFAHDIKTGISYELPRMGKAGWENLSANPGTGARTVVVGTDDEGDGVTPVGEIFVYVGTKTGGASRLAKAGLTNGTLLGVKVAGFPSEPAGGIPSGTAFSTHDFGDVSNLDGPTLASLSVAAGVTAFNRPEDGHWNPANTNHYYFVTTANFSTRNTRLWRLNFNDAANPAAGGTIDLLIDGGGAKMFDNMTVTNDGRYVYLQEDPGNVDYLARIWRYDIASQALVAVAVHDTNRFTTGMPGFLTRDEESSGIIDVSDRLGPGRFLLDVQAHKTHVDPTLVQHGQLLLMTVAEQ